MGENSGGQSERSEQLAECNRARECSGRTLPPIPVWRGSAVPASAPTVPARSCCARLGRLLSGAVGYGSSRVCRKKGSP